MTVLLNGHPRELPHGATLADLLELLGVTARGVAVALDGAVLPRTSWSGTVLREGASVEVLTAVQGG